MERRHGGRPASGPYANSDYLRNLADIAATQDAQRLKQIPFVTIAEQNLGFDRRKQLSCKAVFQAAAKSKIAP